MAGVTTVEGEGCGYIINVPVIGMAAAAPGIEVVAFNSSTCFGNHLAPTTLIVGGSAMKSIVGIGRVHYSSVFTNIVFC